MNAFLSCLPWYLALTIMRLFAGAQQATFDFARSVFRQFIKYDEVNGYFLRTYMLREVVAQLLYALFVPVLAHGEVGNDLLAVNGIGPTDSRRLAHGRIAQNHFLDLARRDIFTAAINHLTQASFDKEVAVFVQIAQVAGAKPAILKRFFAPVILVGLDQARPRDADFAGLSL